MLNVDAPLNELTLAFVDVETTGLSPEYGDRICEIAILRTRGDDVLDVMQQLINPQRPIGPGAFAVNGISDAMVASEPPFVACAGRVAELLGEAVIVGHNTLFDLGFVRHEFAIARTAFPPPIWLDTLRLARRCFRAQSYSLGNLARALRVDVDGRAHRAMVDVLLTRAVLQRELALLWEQDIRTLAEVLDFQGAGEPQDEPVDEADVPPEIRRAIREQRLLWLRYLSEGGQETTRFVRPLAVRRYGEAVLLQAFCLSRNARRTFRLDRILEFDLVDESG